MNPYEAPQASVATQEQGSRRTLYMLAAIGAFLASVYWAGLTLLLALGVASGSVSGMQVILPVVLIVLYAFRGVQLWKGEPAAAQRILALHVVGGILAIVQMAGGNEIVMILHGIKLAIHLFGGVTAHLARRAG